MSFILNAALWLGEYVISKMLSIDSVSLDFCIKAAKDAKAKKPRIKFMLLAAKDAGNNEFDVILAFLDGNKQPISNDGETTEGYSFRTKHVDKKIFYILNGREAVVVQVQS